MSMPATIGGMNAGVKDDGGMGGSNIQLNPRASTSSPYKRKKGCKC